MPKLIVEILSYRQCPNTEQCNGIPFVLTEFSLSKLLDFSDAMAPDQMRQSTLKCTLQQLIGIDGLSLSPKHSCALDIRK